MRWGVWFGDAIFLQQRRRMALLEFWGCFGLLVHMHAWLYMKRCLCGCTWWVCVYYSHGEHSCFFNYGITRFLTMALMTEAIILLGCNPGRRHTPSLLHPVSH